MEPLYLTDPRACIADIMAQHPQLCLNGLDGPWTEEKRREMLEEHAEPFRRACLLLMSVSKTKMLNRNHTSYGLKHVLERAAGVYVANGIAIAALIATGYQIKAHHGINALFNMGEGGYKALDRRRLKNGEEFRGEDVRNDSQSKD